MGHDFYHIGNDAFPHLDTVRPFARAVPFDYGRYDYTATIKLCTVTWPMDYKHVVNWQDEAARDAYFAAIDGRTIELANGFTRTQLDSVRVDVPYDVALTYNYVYMTGPQLTKAEPIDHEAAPGVRVVCAWIQDAIYYAPSATELVLSLDYWTTYLPHLANDVTLMLHRGHAPAYAVTTDEYLSDPKGHSATLLTPDVSFGVCDMCTDSALLDIAQGDKMIVLASTIPASVIDSLALAQTSSSSSTPASYFDTGSRDGHQVGVSGYQWHYGGMTYAGMRNPAGYTGTGGAMPVFTSLYAIDAAQAATAIPTLSNRLPPFVRSIQAAYIMPKRSLNLAGRTYSIAGVTLYRVEPMPTMRDLAAIKLTKEAFGYPARYQHIAKLYTSPYAHLVLADTFGNEIEVRIEDIGRDAKILEQISPMAECLRWDVLLSGVNDSGACAYTWTTLTGAKAALNLPGADIARYTLELGIPTYALYLDGRTAYAADTYYDAQIQRDNAIASYQATMRSANTGKANADASADTSVTNTANDGAKQRANTTISNNQRTTSTARTNTSANRLKDLANAHIFNSLYADDEYTMQASDVNLKSESVAGALSTVGALASGNILGAVTNGLSGIVNITTSAALSMLSSENIEVKEAIGQDYQTNTTAEQVSNATDQASYSNAAATATTNNNVNTANTNAANSANTAKSNAGYTRGTTEANAKQALELARTNYDKQGRLHDLDEPSSFGMVAGNHAPDALMRRVVQVRVETQNKSAIARAGDAMRRFGYTYDGLWEVADWCPKDHAGCYWQASDVIMNARSVDNQQVEQAFLSILIEGTTIWNDPADIGGLPW